MRREVLPVWGSQPIEVIRRRDIITLIDGIADRGAKIMANRTLAHVKRLFRWAAARDIIESDPAAHVEKPAPETRRDRVLADDELATIWGAADAMGFPFGPAVQLLVLTAARREEIFGLSWREVDLDSAAIRLPAERAKTKEGRTTLSHRWRSRCLAGCRVSSGEILSSGRAVRPPSLMSGTRRRGSIA